VDLRRERGRAIYILKQVNLRLALGEACKDLVQLGPLVLQSGHHIINALS
jgi:hypothetical protein